MMALAAPCPAPSPSLESHREFLNRIRGMNKEEFDNYINDFENFHRPRESHDGWSNRRDRDDDAGSLIAHGLLFDGLLF